MNGEPVSANQMSSKPDDQRVAVAATDPAAEPLRLQRNGAAAVVTLNRPQALNAITIGMRGALLQAFPHWARDPDCYVAVMRAAPAGTVMAPVFCAGGDIREMSALAARDPVAATAALASEHRLCWQLECFSKPTISLIDGLVVGTGVGITAYGTHRVAGQGYGFSMPETRIGFFPNAGLAHTFARMPDAIGIYLGLTGRRIGPADAYALRLVTHCIAAEHFDAIEAALGQARPVDPLLDALHADPGPPSLDPHRDAISRCFGQPTVERIVAELETTAAGDGGAAAFARDALADLARASPTALKIALRHIREAAGLDLRQVLIRDCRLAAALFERADFLHGVEAVLGKPPQAAPFVPDRVEGVSDAMVERYFVARPATEVHLPTRAEMQAARV